MKVVLDRIHERFKRNKNWLALIVGETGSGKSWSSLKIAEMLDPNFSVKNICFSPKEFLERIESGELKRGSFLIYDEAGITFGARDFYKDVNKALSYVLQGFRAFNIGTIFTTPNLSFVDVHARKLIHTIIETVSINHNESYCIVKWKNLEHNPLYDKTYYKFPRTAINGKVVTINRMNIYKASDKLIEDYEKKKMRFLKELTKQSLEDIKKQERKKMTDRDLLGINGVNWEDATDIMAKCGVSQQRAYRLRRMSTQNT